jgi:hypothetical protein
MVDYGRVGKCIMRKSKRYARRAIAETQGALRFKFPERGHQLHELRHVYSSLDRIRSPVGAA